jgi:hypothetical protein
VESEIFSAAFAQVFVYFHMNSNRKFFFDFAPVVGISNLKSARFLRFFADTNLSYLSIVGTTLFWLASGTKHPWNTEYIFI